MNFSPKFRMADRLADGRLRQIIREFRAEGQSCEQIARQLFADYGIEVTRGTVAAWAEQIELEAAAS